MSDPESREETDFTDPDITPPTDEDRLRLNQIVSELQSWMSKRSPEVGPKDNGEWMGNVRDPQGEEVIVHFQVPHKDEDLEGLGVDRLDAMRRNRPTNDQNRDTESWLLRQEGPQDYNFTYRRDVFVNGVGVEEKNEYRVFDLKEGEGVAYAPQGTPSTLSRFEELRDILKSPQPSK